MEEEKREEQEAPEKEEIKYATPMQRVWAWVGVVYMVMLVLLTTYALAHGAYLRGIGALMMVPALAGVGASAVVRYRQGQGRGGLPACLLISGASAFLVVLNLMRGVPALLAQL